MAGAPTAHADFNCPGIDGASDLGDDPCDFCRDHPGECGIPGQFCPSSWAYPVKCPSGNYCPDLSTKVRCPEGFFCREGSFCPAPCNPLVVCDEGSSAETKGFAGLVFMTVLLLFGFLAYQVYDYVKKKRRDEREHARAIALLRRHADQKREGSAAAAAAVGGGDAESGLARSAASAAVTGAVNVVNPLEQGPSGNGIGSGGGGDGDEGAADRPRRHSSVMALGDSVHVASVVGVTLRFQDIVYKRGHAPHMRSVLSKVSGSFERGTMTAVMGPSGCGKTTLIKLLSGRKLKNAQNFSGNVSVAVQETSASGETHIDTSAMPEMVMKRLIGYVPQDDIMLPHLTVKEAIQYSGLLRLPAAMTETERMNRADQIVTLLDLHHQRHNRLGDVDSSGVSGGQRKRCNIGVELVANPSVVFLDEPTSGLDSAAAEQVMQLLRRLANGGRTIVCVVHQPRYEIFEMFDNVLLLRAPTVTRDQHGHTATVGGRVEYSGPRTGIIKHFTDKGMPIPGTFGLNPADFIIDCVSGRRVKGGQGGGATKRCSECGTPQLLNRRRTPSEAKRTDRTLSLSVSASGAAAGAGGGRPAMGADARQSSSRGVRRATQVAGALAGAGRRLRNQLTAGTLDDPDAAAAVQKLASQAPPSFMYQLLYFTRRSFIHQSRILGALVTDLCLVCAAGAVLGMVYFDSDEEDDLLQTVSLTCLTVGMTAIMHSQRWFSKELSVVHREHHVGVSMSAYFLAKNLAHLPFIFVSPAVYLAFYYTFAAPRATLASYYEALLLVELVATGVGYCVPLLFKGRAQLAGVVFPLICTMFGGVSPSLNELNDWEVVGPFMYSISYNRWATELMYLANARKQHPELFHVDNNLERLHYSFDTEVYGVLVMLSMAVLFRMGAFLLLWRSAKNTLKH